MKKVLNILKWSFGIIILLLALITVFLSFPEVKKVHNQTGAHFAKTNEWDQDTIQSLQAYLLQANHIDAFIAIDKEEEIFSFGETDKLINLHSARKPLISLLIGIAQDKGLIALDETLGEIGISEHGIELTDLEKSATIRNLLMARSGVYIDADAQPDMDKKRPRRGQYKPGEYYYYNNFDFNALATILHIKTGMSYEQCLYSWLAVPLEMQEFHIENVVYGTPFSTIKTQHPAYKTWMSARDLAKIGSMISQKGIWKGTRIVSEAWIKESTKPYHIFPEEDRNWPKDAYSYLWAIDTQHGNIWGSGYGGQFLMIDTTNQLSLVQRHYTGNSILSQGLYIRKNTQSSPADLMNIWYALLRTKALKNKMQNVDPR